MTVGILGAGQLGRMLALAGLPLGLRFRFLDAVNEAPAGQLAPLTVAAFDDHAALARFADGVRLVTYEFENVPVACARFLAERVPVYPPPAALEAAQDRVVEKQYFQRLGIPTPAFAPVQTRADLDAALTLLGPSGVLKARRLGYDGKGQYVLRSPGDAEPAWQALGGNPLILEAFVPFERELSILGVRGRDGDTAFYPLVENHHREGMLRLSLAPAPNLTEALQTQAQDYASRVLTAVDYVGVLAIEFFQVEGNLLANEMAPRVHNSGHWTIEGAVTSQFENHLRAVMGWPLGGCEAVGHSAMLNFIGTTPAPADVLRVPDAHLHLYGKEAQPGRKLGHASVRASEAGALVAKLSSLQAVLPNF